MIMARIAEVDLKANDPKAYTKVMEMLEPLNELTQAGQYPFIDAAVYVKEASKAGFSLTNLWSYQWSFYFDGVPTKKVEQHNDFDITTQIGLSQTAIDWTSSSRIDKTFGKSFSLRYVFNLLTDLHQPYHNIVRFSQAHADGDDFGKLHKINHKDYSNLFELFEDAFGQYPAQSYPLASLTEVDNYAADIMKSYPKSQFAKEIADESKANWSKDSYDIAKNFGYTLKEGAAPSAQYLAQGKDLLNKQMAIAGYRLSHLVSYMMSKQLAQPNNTVVKDLIK
eukprot:CAMPEP_0168342914 /NCGR_PEP_ID=MMETSP0213-20121227/15715_1 /TAXON_ID=151035 /ORGANISM="Euplotes harpa, Strain FSP1.4" /LENGTH=279 /DNA_ID=CAMNT_0008349977 /DNA_START=72 /DNA_END=911 /DNA_ORIENTATION=+